MARRLNLPVATTEAPSGAPTVDQMRKHLGGRAGSQEGAGALVEVANSGGLRRAGVLLHIDPEHAYVFMQGDMVKRCDRERVSPAADLGRPEFLSLSSAAGDARAFAALGERDRVRYQPSGDAFETGVLIEKCRFGALVERGDGTVVAVGFRRLWPISKDSGDN